VTREPLATGEARELPASGGHGPPMPSRPTEIPIVVPEPSLVLLAGVAGCGKSTFAARHFRPTEVLSSDRCRALVSDDENDQHASGDAFRVLHTILAMRLKRPWTVSVVDATNLRRRDRRPFLRRAQAVGRPVVLLVLDLPVAVCIERDEQRTMRVVGEETLRRQSAELEQGLADIDEEGLYATYLLRTPKEVDSARVVRVPFQDAEPLPPGTSARGPRPQTGKEEAGRSAPR
jgi:predicted kinase